MGELLQVLDTLDLKGLLENQSILIQLSSIIVFSIILVKSTAYGKEKRVMPTLINFGIILGLNALNILNLFMISKINMNVATYCMSGINPITIMILLLILETIDAKVFWFCLCTFSFRLIYESQWEAIWLGWLLLSIVLALLCSKMYQRNVALAYLVIYIVSVAVKIVLSEVNLYVLDSELIYEESVVSGLVFLTFAVLRLIRSIMAASSLGATITKIGKFALVAVMVIGLIIGIRYTIQSVLKSAGEKEDKKSIEIAEETDAEQLVTVVKGNSSSYLLSFSSGKSYTVDLSFDSDLLTCWQDGSSGDGSGESLGYSFDGEHSIGKVCIYNGNLLSHEKYDANNRVKNAMLQFYNDGNMVYERSVYLLDDFEQSQKGISFIMDEKIACNQVILQIIDVYTGSRYNDLCITEVKFYE